MTAPWWAAFPPLSARVPCGAATHQLRWAGGELTAADHADAESELVLAALGGEAAGCVQMIQAWNGHCDDPDVLALGPRGARDKLARRDAGDVMPRSGWSGRTVSSRPMAMAYSSTVTMSLGTSSIRIKSGRPADPATARRAELLELFRLGRGFQFRLAAVVAANLAVRQATATAVPRAELTAELTAALSGRFAPAAASWLGIGPDDVDVTGYDGAGWGELALAGGRLRAALPAGCLASVWAPGIAVIGRRLVVEVTGGSWPVLEVRAVRHPGSEPEPMRITRRAGRWMRKGAR
jgi:hypothetical protein